ncbi:MAG: hypothetical protein RSB39_07550 [Oscillospiraceae bacterium]
MMILKTSTLGSIVCFGFWAYSLTIGKSGSPQNINQTAEGRNKK